MTQLPNIPQTVVQEPVSVVVHHHIRGECSAAFERWLHEEVFPKARQFTGHLGADFLRAAPDSEEYLVIIRFQNDATLKAFLDSPRRAEWQQQSITFLRRETEETIVSRPDVWLMLGSQPVLRPPRRERLFLLMWSVVFPLILMLGVVLPSILPVGTPRWIILLATSAIVVSSMIFIVAPFLTRHFADWLAPHEPDHPSTRTEK